MKKKEAATSAMYAALQEEWSKIPSDLEGVVHHDVWTDDWKRYWFGLLLSYLHPVSGEPRSCFIALGTPDTGGSMTASSIRDACVSGWRDNMAPKTRLSLALDGMPPLVMSDSTNSAVAVARMLDGRPDAHCVNHFHLLCHAWLGNDGLREIVCLVHLVILGLEP